MATGSADLILKNGSIYTVDENRSWAEAIAISQGAIVFVGSNNEAEAFMGAQTKVIDLGGKMVLPGFVEAHAHPSHTMDVVGNISLHLDESVEAYLETIGKFVKDHPDRDYYRGSGWADTLFPNLGPPKELLDQIMPDRPIALVSYDGYSMWVNSETLRRANITSSFDDPDGGRIERDPGSGEPTGALRELAMDLVKEVIPDYSLEERQNALMAYQDMAAKAGITLSHDAMLDEASILAFKSLADGGNLKIRFRGSITLDPHVDLEEQMDFLIQQRLKNTDEFFQTNAGKIFVDGVVEGGTAYLLDPYAYKPDFRGEPIWSAEKLEAACQVLDKEKFQIHLHVIGDAATRITLDAIESTWDTNGKRDARPLVTHLHVVAEEDIPRFGELDIVGVPQPFWFKIDDYYYELALPYLGKERADKQYPMKSFIDSGTIMASSSDFPVTIPFDPLIGIQIGVTRYSPISENKEVLWPEERCSLEEMIVSYTYNGAYANFLEKETGSLEVGKRADLIVLDQNLFEISEAEIYKTAVVLTLVNGGEAYRKEGFQ